MPVRPLAIGFVTLLCSSAVLFAAPELNAVPAPWTALRARPDSISCWGREHLVEGALPRQIVSQGMPLLAGPVAFQIDDRAALEWKQTGFAPQPRVADWTATGSQGDASVTSRISYDGFWTSR